MCVRVLGPFRRTCQRIGEFTTGTRGWVGVEVNGRSLEPSPPAILCLQNSKYTADHRELALRYRQAMISVLFYTIREEIQAVVELRFSNNKIEERMRSAIELSIFENQGIVHHIIQKIKHGHDSYLDRSCPDSTF